MKIVPVFTFICSYIPWMVEDKLAVLMAWGQHLMFFLFIIIMSVYLQIPRFSRLAIIAALTANAVAELKFEQSIGFRHVLSLIVTVVTGKCNIVYKYKVCLIILCKILCLKNAILVKILHFPKDSTMHY